MSRAEELLPSSREEPDVYPGLEMTAAQAAAVDLEEQFVPGDPDVRVLVCRPKDASGTLPLIFEIHGGAFCFMRPDMFPANLAAYALLGAVVVSVDYRLAPKHRFPAGLDDCYAALSWAVKELDVDPDRVVVTGGSAGGALAAALALRVRDQGGPSIAFQALNIPVLDDRLATPSTKQFRDFADGFNGANAEGMWLHYLGEGADRSVTSPYAAPARATDLTGLPPACITVNGLDPLRDEGIEYAMRLMAAGVPVELYCAPGCPHGGIPADMRVQAQASAILRGAIARAIE